MVALGSYKPLALENLISSKRNNFIVMPLAVQDPGNLGAIIRSAVAAGSSGVIVDHSSADPYSWKALRGSMGCTFRLPIANTNNMLETLTQARRHGWVIVATSPHTGTSIYDATLNRRVVLLVGNEGSGLESRLRQEVDLTLSIPMSGKIESLNVAVATAIIAYEIRRQRSLK
jgi:TrmH family RNA methyltransferase